jgi:hypothetical protein
MRCDVTCVCLVRASRCTRAIASLCWTCDRGMRSSRGTWCDMSCAVQWLVVWSVGGHQQTGLVPVRLRLVSVMSWHAARGDDE